MEETWVILDDDGKVIEEVLVWPATSTAGFPATGKQDVYYFDEPNNVWYVWDGTGYAVFDNFIGHRPTRP